MDGEVTSVWHLGEFGIIIEPAGIRLTNVPKASIIIDQCSRVFFDRTKPLDLRPEVMDLFAESLNNVVSPQNSGHTIQVIFLNNARKITNVERTHNKRLRSILESSWSRRKRH